MHGGLWTLGGCHGGARAPFAAPAGGDSLQRGEESDTTQALTEFGDGIDRVLPHLTCARQCRGRASPVETGAPHNTALVECSFLWLLGD